MSDQPYQPPAEDFDAFWAAQQAEAARKRVRIRGVEVPIPTDVPLQVQLSMDAGDLSEDTMRTLVAVLYGQGALDQWMAAGMGSQELGVVLAWSTLRAQGVEVTFAEAITKAQEMADKAEEQQARSREAKATLAKAAAGSTVSEHDRKAAEALVDAGKAPSSASGAWSKPTSDASTGSGPTSWPGWGPASSASSWQG